MLKYFMWVLVLGLSTSKIKVLVPVLKVTVYSLLLIIHEILFSIVSLPDLLNQI